MYSGCVSCSSYKLNRCESIRRNHEIVSVIWREYVVSLWSMKHFPHTMEGDMIILGKRDVSGVWCYFI